MAELKITLRDTANNTLKAWGAWSRDCGNIGYPKNSIMPEFGGGISIASITDDDAMKINDSLLAMKKINPAAFDFAKEFWIEDKPIYKTTFGKNRGPLLRDYVLDWVERDLFPYFSS